MSKIGLIIEGGGMRGIYGCGVLDGFLDNNIHIKYSIGVSAGSANMASYMADQMLRNYRFYTQYAFDERYMGVKSYIKTGSFFGMDFIYDELTNNVDPIDYQTLLDPSNEFYIVATNAETGEAKYFSREDMAEAYERKDTSNAIFKASSSVPLMCKPVEINGVEYFDGGVADSIPVERALTDGCDKIIAILTRPRNYVKPPEHGKQVYTEVLKNYPKVIEALNNRHIVYRNSMNMLLELERSGNALLFFPRNLYGVNLYSRNRPALENLYKEGKDEAESRIDDIRAFIGKNDD
ncbi:MAG: patatin family protein [Clostridia bacterium]|nr:patatin family protein [Clostridia bacterium]